MFKKTLMMTVLTGVLVSATGLALAAEQDRTRLQDQNQTQDQIQDMIYGSQLMSQEERNEYHKQIRSAKTDKEREQIRAQHHERMKVRAKEHGLVIPEDAPPRSRGMGSGMGMGGGMGSGGGSR